MATYTFDPSEDTATPEQVAAETAAMEQGEKLVAAQEEDRARRMEQVSDENEDVALIGGKFKSQEDLLKAYEELQSKLGKGESEESEEPSEETVEEEEGEVEETTVTPEAITRASEIYARDGKLTEESIEELAKMDSRELIEAYVNFYSESQTANAAAAVTAEQTASIQAIAGGEKGYGELMQWAATNLDSTEIANFNSVADSGNVTALRFAVEALNNRRVAAEGVEAPLVTGRRAAPKTKGYRSNAELARDIADPRYSSDPAFRADVEARLAASGDLL